MNVPTSGSAFITRFAPDGSLAFSTLFGGSCFSQAHDVALDSAGNAWVAGETNSPDLPVTSGTLQPQYGGGISDGFLARFDLTGQLTYSTYLGGSNWEVLDAIALDRSGNVYLTGTGDGFQQPASPGAFQPKPQFGCIYLPGLISTFIPQGSAFVLKLDPTVTVVQGLTYIGQLCSLNGNSIAVDSSGAPWISSSIVSGGNSNNLQPVASPIQQQIGTGLISKFSPDLTQLLFSTYFDQPNQLVLDSAGFAYVAGAAQSAVDPFPQEAFFAKLDGSISAISLNSVVPAAIPAISRDPGIGPGEVLRIAGKNMGPAAVTPGIVANNAVTTNVAGVQVTFDGIPAPLLSVSATEIQCVSPFAIAGRGRTSIQVQYNGVPSNALSVNALPAVIEVLGVFNEDFTPNSQANP
ncbi:MAG TPA: IPT/TIG domain-containing protein, partial [Bryobacteraceae bacterium]|nr:IPT/TIG domain-containing protein [Bryobacteraceae bacterium]